MMKKTLSEGLPRLGLQLPESVQDTLCAFGSAVVEQNKVMNLTAITEPDRVAKLHLLDSLTLLTLAAPMYGFANDIAAALVVVMFAAVAYYYFGTLTTEKIIKRSELLLSDFSEAVSKLALLTNAGMNLREAWREVSKAGDTELYQEMRITVNQMDNGMREPDAFYEFGIRCVIPEIKKLTSTIAQALVRGPKEVADTLQAQSKEVWATKKQTVRRKGETAASKLLIPMMLMLVGILVMVVIPIFANIGV